MKFTAKMVYIVKNNWSNAKSVRYKNRKYDSKFEGSYARELDLRQKAGEIERWEAQVLIPLAVNGYKVCGYTIDFIAYYPDGAKEFIETKGYATPLWRLKWKIFEALYSDLPNVKLTVVKQRNNFYLRKLKKIK